MRLLGIWTTPVDPTVLVRTFLPASPRQKASPRQHEAAPAVPATQPSDALTIAWGAEALVEADPELTILESLEADGIEPTVGCRRGVCRRCVVPLTSGGVRDRRDARDVDAGTHVRICVSSPLTSVALDPTGTADHPTKPALTGAMR